MTFFNWIIFREEEKENVISALSNPSYAYEFYRRVINHEEIHLRQWRETLYLFWVIYLIEWVIRVITPPWKTAYMDISFEREAYDNEDNPNYLKYRKPFAWIKDMFKPSNI